ncbi:hypothetical protein [Mycobacteroides abscessus]|uniref:hypothetical protein n=1 Tax=Mycobacteroides abscessus TaxID=36809 RepID=UPI0012FFE849|nr:hypothetical protein [Mycobacteroides abscessus]
MGKASPQATEAFVIAVSAARNGKTIPKDKAERLVGKDSSNPNDSDYMHKYAGKARALGWFEKRTGSKWEKVTEYNLTAKGIALVERHESEKTKQQKLSFGKDSKSSTVPPSGGRVTIDSIMASIKTFNSYADIDYELDVDLLPLKKKKGGDM